MASQRFRINKASLDARRYQWQDDEDIDKVLEQERNAWLSHLSENASDNDTIRARGLRHTTKPVTSLSDTEDYMDWQKTPERNSTAYDTGYASAPDNASRPHILTRKSFFKEGSMNEASKATASTWSEKQDDNTRPASIASSSYLEDTPRSSMTSRASISSSLDINEFKPLPETPSTIKHTIKRFGQKLKSNKQDTKQTLNEQHDYGTVKPSKRGLRKSMSTWFTNTAENDTDESVSIPPTPENEKNTRRTHALRTLRFRNRGRVEKTSHDQQKSILDDRKRKAEIAYAEQFGTVRHQPQKPAATQNAFEPNTVRRSERLQGPGIKDVTTTQQLQRQELLAQQTVEAMMTDTTNMSHSATTINRQSFPPRSSSRNSNSSIESETDRMKRMSQAESRLEKENQELRRMLREKQDRSLKRRRADASSSNWEIHADNDDSDAYTVVTTHSAASATGKRRRTVQQVEEDPDAPPVPPLPTLRHSLSPISGNQARASETSTVKRYGPVLPRGRNIELPRPLSMVLEGREDGSDSGEEVEDTPRKRLKMSYDGAGDAVSDAKEVSAQGKVKHGEQWVWPDDVF